MVVRVTGFSQPRHRPRHFVRLRRLIPTSHFSRNDPHWSLSSGSDVGFVSLLAWTDCLVDAMMESDGPLSDRLSSPQLET